MTDNLGGGGELERPTPAAAQGLLSQMAELLGLVFKPGAEELGLIVRDEVQAWRLSNLRRLASKLRKRDVSGRAHPRVAIAALEQASATDDETLLSMWAGLLDSSRSETPDDANITFVGHLARMSALQARILNHLCARCAKLEADGLVVSRTDYFQIDSDEVFGPVPRQLLDQELDNLRASGLADVGIDLDRSGEVRGCPTPLGLYLYVRCQGSQLAPVDYFVLEVEPLRPPAAPPEQGGGEPSSGP